MNIIPLHFNLQLLLLPCLHIYVLLCAYVKCEYIINDWETCLIRTGSNTNLPRASQLKTRKY